jgi:adenylate cyclase
MAALARPAVLWAVSALAASLVALLAGTAGSPLVRDIEGRSADLIYRWGADRAPERRVILVDIDERSLSEIGPWPWPRQTQAQLMDRLQAAGAALQVWDFTFAGEGAGATAQQRQQGIRALRQAIDRNGAVTGQILALPGSLTGRPTDSSTITEGQPAGALAWDRCGAPFQNATGHLSPPEPLLQGMRHPAVGHITPRLEADGLLRRQPAVICWEGRAYPALTLAALSQASGGTGWELERGGWFEAPWRLQQQASVGGLSLPLDERGDLTIAWRQHPVGYVSVSAADALAGRIPTGMLVGAWVLVGGSAFGLNDRVATPFSPQSPGMIAHAQLLLNALDERTPYTPRAEGALQAAAALLGLVLLIATHGLRRRSRSGPGSLAAPGGTAAATLPLLALLAVPALWALHAATLVGLGISIGWFTPALTVVTFGFTLGLLAHARSRVDRERLYRHLASYLPAAVAQTLAGQDPSNRIQASQRAITVLMADIRNFSAFCEARPPEEAAGVLHGFLMKAHAIVQAHGGQVEALQGDSLVATWIANPGEAQGQSISGNVTGKSSTPSGSNSATGDTADTADRALRAARELLLCASEFLPAQALPGLEPLALGIGLETGPAMTGSIGPAERRTHAVLGRTVTIASRLVGMTTDLAHPLLVGEGMAAQLGGQHGGQPLQSLGVFLLEGLRMPHHIYAWPLGPQPPESRERPLVPPSAEPTAPTPSRRAPPLH